MLQDEQIESGQEEVAGEGPDATPANGLPQPDPLAALAAGVEANLRAVDRLALRLDGLQSILDRVTDENRALRSGELETAMQPVLMEIVRLHDDLAATAASYRSPDPGHGRVPALDFEMFALSAMDALQRLGVSQVEARVGDRFDPRVHNPVAAEPTGDRGHDMTISAIVRPGFAKGARSVRPPQVKVFRYAPGLEPVPEAPVGQPATPDEPAPPVEPVTGSEPASPGSEAPETAPTPAAASGC